MNYANYTATGLLLTLNISAPKRITLEIFLIAAKLLSPLLTIFIFLNENIICVIGDYLDH